MNKLFMHLPLIGKKAKYKLIIMTTCIALHLSYCFIVTRTHHRKRAHLELGRKHEILFLTLPGTE